MSCSFLHRHHVQQGGHCRDGVAHFGDVFGEVGPCNSRSHRRANGVATAGDLFVLRVRVAHIIAVDDVIGWEPHRIVKLSRGEHPQADVCDEVERPADAQKQQVVIGQLITTVAVQQFADQRPAIQILVRASLAKQRVAEAKKLGFSTCILPKVSLKGLEDMKGIRLIGVENVQEAMRNILQ